MNTPPLLMRWNWMSEHIEQTLEEHSLKIKELEDEIDFKKWKIDSLIEKIDNLTTVVQQIQINQLKDDSDIKNRITTIESTLNTLKWVVGIGLSGLAVAIAIIGLFIKLI